MKKTEKFKNADLQTTLPKTKVILYNTSNRQCYTAGKRSEVKMNRQNSFH